MERITKIEKELLKKSVIYNISLEGDETFYANNILTHNTPPHMPPVDAIKEWCISKGIPEALAYPIAMKIKAHGTRPQSFIRPYINNRMTKDLKENLKQAFK